MGPATLKKAGGLRAPPAMEGLRFGQALRQVIAERCKEHIKVRGRRSAGSAPGLLVQVRVLESLAEAPLWSAVEVIPISDRGLLNVPSIGTAARWIGGAGRGSVVASRGDGRHIASGGGSGKATVADATGSVVQLTRGVIAAVVAVDF